MLITSKAPLTELLVNHPDFDIEKICRKAGADRTRSCALGAPKTAVDHGRASLHYRDNVVREHVSPDGVGSKGQRISDHVYLVGTTSVEINIERVKARFLKGGHDVLEEDQRRRFPRTLRNLRKLLPVADFVVLIDNSTESGYEVAAFGHGSYMHWKQPVPSWAEGLQEVRPGCSGSGRRPNDPGW